MKKTLLLLSILILAFPLANAASSVFDIMDKVDEFYYLVLTEDAVGGDTAAATEIALGLLNHNTLEIETVIEGEISENLPRIIIGPPCGSEYIEGNFAFSCEEWPYEEGQALIKVDENNILITGTTPNDRRRAGIILRDYPYQQELKDYSFILVTGDSLTSAEINLTKAKTEKEFVCGDGVCEPGEAYFCFPDCMKKTCFDICKEENFIDSFCRDIPTNPELKICKDDELNKGMKYCTGTKSCCCKIKPLEEENTITETPQTQESTQEETQSFWSIILKEKTSTTVVIGVFAIMLLIILILGGYLIFRR